MIKSKNFLENEKDSVIIQKNFNFINDSYDINHHIIVSAKKWISYLNISNETLSKNQKLFDQFNLNLKNKDCNRIRILSADAERTFSSKQNISILISVTSFLYDLFNDYQQNITFISSFLLLFLNPNEVISIMEKINRDENYLKGHFNAVAVGAKVDITLFDEISTKYNLTPNLINKLKNQKVPPEYLKKWFSGLCVHLLPFQQLFSLFDGFFLNGFKYCLKFAFSTFWALEPFVKSFFEVPELLRLLELKSSAFSSKEEFFDVCKKIIDKTKENEKENDNEFYFVDEIDLEKERKSVYERKIKQKLIMADKYAKENPIEEIPVCKICKEGFQELYCKECEIKLCEDCHETPPDNSNHQKEHSFEECEESE